MSASLKLAVVILVLRTVQCQTNEVVENNNSGGWWSTAQNVVASPAGHIMVQVAKELINRSTGSSQILSLNLSNLFILVLLKALVFAAGLIGAGHWTHNTYSRKLNNSMFDDSEPMLYIGFLAAQGSGDKSCLHKAACSAPATAYEYARAARALLEGIQKFGGLSTNISEYKSLIDVIERAAYDGYKGIPCDLLQRCNI